MCGITGFLSPAGFNHFEAKATLATMRDRLRHRGPDDAGSWLDAEAGIALGHRRLSIVDLSSAGHQPMVSDSGRLVITYNGEIYNHRDLRERLANSTDSWRGHSDTETLLVAIETWGLDNALREAHGMFAFALWDRESQSLYLARDRMGEKPLYFGWQGNVFLFGSELKAMQAHPAFEGEIDRDVISLFMVHNYIPAPYSIYRGVSKLLPGSFIKVQGSSSKGQETPKAYWSLEDVVTENRTHPIEGSDAEAIDALEALLRDSVHRQMLADVPLGAFLSGGIDSSLIAALMQAQSPQPVSTFTIGFHEVGYNEAFHAKSVAQHLGTKHTELYVTSEQAQAVIPKLPTLYDEPFSDSSRIPTFLVSELTRKHVTVSLSGDGGDELFGGYSRYTSTSRLWNALEKFPHFMRNGLSKSILMIPISGWNLLSTPIRPFLPPRMRNIGDKAHKLAARLAPASQMDFYRRFVSHWAQSEGVLLRAREPENYFSLSNERLEKLEYFESMMLADALTYLPDDILVKVDRAAMGTSLETRVPILDHRVVEFAWGLPIHMKIRNGQGKWLLRKVLHKYVPQELIDRPKMGFSVPVDSWLRGPLRDWAENLLDETRLQQEGFFNPAPIRKKWAAHLSGQRNWAYQLWDVLIFQAWLSNQSKNYF